MPTERHEVVKVLRGRKQDGGSAPGDASAKPASVGEPDTLESVMANTEYIGNMSDAELANLFVERAQGRIKFNHHRRKWVIWENDHWTLDELERVILLVNGMIFAIVSRRQMKSEERKKLLSASAIHAVEKLARSRASSATVQNDWDSDRDLLGTPDGIVDLRTGSMLPATPDHLILRRTIVAPDFAADCPQFKKFLDEATGCNLQLLDWLQLWVGYCLTGHVREERLVFFYGEGGNGKGVFLGTIQNIMGEYARSANFKVFTTEGARDHSTSIAALAGARMIFSQEVNEGESWNLARIKEFTGRDKIAARFMRENDFEFDPTGKLNFSGNSKPKLDNIQRSIRRRFILIPFDKVPAKEDTNLKDRLIEQEGAAILAWAIKGAYRWYASGLPDTPEIVRDATEQYFSEQDLVKRWIEEDCQIDIDLEDSSAALHRAYANFTGDRKVSKRKLTDALKSLGFKYVRRNDFRGFSGIKSSKQFDETLGFASSKFT